MQLAALGPRKIRLYTQKLANRDASRSQRRKGQKAYQPEPQSPMTTGETGRIVRNIIYESQ